MNADPQHMKSDGSRRILLWAGIAAAVAIIVLLFLPSQVHVVVDADDHPGYNTLCSSIVAAGWPVDVGTSPEDRMAARGVMSTDDSDGPAYEICQTRRTLYTAGIGILAIPASSLIVLAATRGSRRNSARTET
jgi:hypothetical protein